MATLEAFDDKIINSYSEGSSGGGHEIVNPSGTAMPQEDKLQFTGDLSVSDDSSNGKTVVNVAGYTSIDYEDWNELTPSQQESGKWLITGVPGADGSIQIDLMTKLWENPDPTASFAAQNIVLSSSDYDMLLWLYKQNTDSNRILSKITKKGYGVVLDESSGSYSGGTYTRNRLVDRTDDITFSVKDAYHAYEAVAGTVDNTEMIPYQIYGIKTTQQITISAIARDVSTSADKCMLSDGVTSVQDALNGIEIASVVADGVKTRSQLLNELYAQIDANTDLTCTVFTDGTNVMHCSNKGSTLAAYGSVYNIPGTGMVMASVHMEASGSTDTYILFNTSAVGSYNDNSGLIPSAGTIYKIVK